MNAKHTQNCEELRTMFEGGEAIYVEQGALRVRVCNIQARGFRIRGEVEEIVTPGLGVGRFHRPGARDARPRKWRIRAGYLTSFSAESWDAGYGGWSLYFAPRTVRAVIDFAAHLPENADVNQTYGRLNDLLRDLDRHESSQHVFPDVVEPGSGEFRGSDLPAMVVEESSGWAGCPFCDMRFALSDVRRWDGERHLTCGQRIIIH